MFAILFLLDVSRLIFALGEGEWGGSPRRREGAGVSFLIESPSGEGSPGREWPRGREGVCSESGNLGGGGGLNFFWGGRNVHQVFEAHVLFKHTNGR